MITTRAKEAIGRREGDTLTIANAFETVTIVRVERGFVIDGERGLYLEMGPALVAAFEHLAEYERGRCD